MQTITVSSHVLDSIIGDHAAGIRIAAFKLMADDTRDRLFDVIANREGRIAEQLPAEAIAGASIELIFFGADYFDAQPATPPSGQILREIVVRVAVPRDVERIHIPIMLSPHAYSIWWSA